MELCGGGALDSVYRSKLYLYIHNIHILNLK